jgi:hypothetical protein
VGAEPNVIDVLAAQLKTTIYVPGTRKVMKSPVEGTVAKASDPDIVDYVPENRFAEVPVVPVTCWEL